MLNSLHEEVAGLFRVTVAAVPIKQHCCRLSLKEGMLSEQSLVISLGTNILAVI